MARLPFAAKQDPVEYLVRKRHPDGCFRDSAVDSTPLSPATRAAIDAANAYRTELHALPKVELQTLFEKARAAEAEQTRIAAEATEEARAFNSPEARADFKYWASMSYWTIDEAVALSFDRNPKVASWDAMNPFLRISPFVQRFVEKREIALRAKAMGQLWERTIPNILIAWAQRMGFELPQDLVAEVIARGIVVADWKAIAETAQKELSDERKARFDATQEQKIHLDEMIEQSRRTMQSYVDLVETKDKHIAALSEEVGLLSQEVAIRRNDSTDTDTERPVGTRERESMVKLIIGMAAAGYSYNHKATRSAVPGEIEADLARLGIGLDGDTIRKYLREGAEHLPGNQDE